MLDCILLHLFFTNFTTQYSLEENVFVCPYSSLKMLIMTQWWVRVLAPDWSIVPPDTKNIFCKSNLTSPLPFNCIIGVQFAEWAKHSKIFSSTSACMCGFAYAISTDIYCYSLPIYNSVKLVLCNQFPF